MVVVVVVVVVVVFSRWKNTVFPWQAFYPSRSTAIEKRPELDSCRSYARQHSTSDAKVVEIRQHRRRCGKTQFMMVRTASFLVKKWGGLLLRLPFQHGFMQELLASSSMSLLRSWRAERHGSQYLGLTRAQFWTSEWRAGRFKQNINIPSIAMYCNVLPCITIITTMTMY